MIRTINFLFIAVTGLVCLGLYHVAEAARIATADLTAAEHSIVREHDQLTVLQAEWAHLTQPGRVAALAARHLDLTDKPTMELSSLTSLPRRGDAPLVAEGDVRNARVVVPATRAPAPVENVDESDDDTASVVKISAPQPVSQHTGA